MSFLFFVFSAFFCFFLIYFKRFNLKQKRVSPENDSIIPNFCWTLTLKQNMNIQAKFHPLETKTFTTSILAIAAFTPMKIANDRRHVR